MKVSATDIQIALAALEKSQAVTPFTAIPTAATAITAFPATGSGWWNRNQSHRVAADPVASLHQHESGVKGDANREGPPECPGGMGVSGTVVMVVAMHAARMKR